MRTFHSIDEFINLYQEKHPDGHFFDKDTLKFFGERRSAMGVLKKLETIVDISGKPHQCYVVSSLRTKPSRGRVYHYFDVDTLEDVILP